MVEDRIAEVPGVTNPLDRKRRRRLRWIPIALGLVLAAGGAIGARLVFVERAAPSPSPAPSPTSPEAAVEALIAAIGNGDETRFGDLLDQAAVASQVLDAVLPAGVTLPADSRTQLLTVLRAGIDLTSLQQRGWGRADTSVTLLETTADSATVRMDGSDGSLTLTLKRTNGVWRVIGASDATALVYPDLLVQLRDGFKGTADVTAPERSFRAELDETYGTFSPMTQTGRGTTAITPPPIGAIIITTDFSGPGMFVMWLRDASGTQLDGIVGLYEYHGEELYVSDTPGKVTIEAEGEWSVTFSPLSAAPTLQLPTSLKGNKVFIYEGPASSWVLTHDGKSNFAVKVHGQGTAGPLVNVIGPYNGVIAVGAGPAIVEVLADGNWTVAAQ